MLAHLEGPVPRLPDGYSYPLPNYCAFMVSRYSPINTEKWRVILAFIVMPLIRIHSLSINDWMWWAIVYEFYISLAIDLLVFDELKLY